MPLLPMMTGVQLTLVLLQSVYDDWYNPAVATQANGDISSTAIAITSAETDSNYYIL